MRRDEQWKCLRRWFGNTVVEQRCWKGIYGVIYGSSKVCMSTAYNY